MRLSLKVAAATVAIAGVAAGVGQAAISNDGVVTMCVNSTSGAVRVVDPTGPARPCSNTETVLPMNQKGVDGAVGPAGPAGPQGPAGPASLPSVIAKWRKGNFEPAEHFAPAIKVPLATGAYHVTAKGTAYQYELLGKEFWAAVTCQLRVRHAGGSWEVMDTAVVEVSDGGPEYASFALQGVMRVGTAAPESAQLACKDDGGVGGGVVVLRHLNVHATPIAGYTQSEQSEQ